MKPLDQIVTKINALAGLNILDNTRKREYIEARAVFCVIAYKYVGLNLSQVAQYFKDRGKSSDHATILHALKNYEIYSKYNSQLNLWLSDIVCSTDLKVTSKKQIAIHKISQMSETNIDLLEKPIEMIYLKNIKENQETNEN
jgi:hypothetical protein